MFLNTIILKSEARIKETKDQDAPTCLAQSPARPSGERQAHPHKLILSFKRERDPFQHFLLDIQYFPIFVQTKHFMKKQLLLLKAIIALLCIASFSTCTKKDTTPGTNGNPCNLTAHIATDSSTVSPYGTLALSAKVSNDAYPNTYYT